MINLRKYQNKKIAIYGMGLTGCSAARTLKKLGTRIFCWDDNAQVRKKIENSNFLLNKFWLGKNLIDNIVISPGIDISKCKIKDYLNKNLNKIITDLDLFFDLNKDGLIISITGTNGKSTTCKIIEKILKIAKYKVKTVGNIGNPILSLNKTGKKYAVILEVSSYQLQYSKLFRSKHAAILNISVDHLERHKNIRNYIKTKSRIFFAQNSSDYSYINLTNKYSKSIINIFKTKKLKSKLISINKSIYNLLRPLIIILSFIFKFLAILYAKIIFSILPWSLKYLLLIFLINNLKFDFRIGINLDFNFLFLNIFIIDFEYLFVKFIYE